MSFVLALAGRPAAGKTTVAECLAAVLGAKVVSFGDYVRSEATRQGLQSDRETLQQLGLALRQRDSDHGFVRAALAHAGAESSELPVIWDGVRHPSIVAALAELYVPTPIYLIALAPPEPARRRRFAEELGNPEILARVESHESERHLDELLDRADLVCQHSSPDEMWQAIAAWLRNRG